MMKKIIAKLTQDEKMAKNLKRASTRKDGLTRYLAYLQSPWKIIFHNFIAGVAYGFGFLVGAALVIGILGYIVQNVLSQIPFVGDSIAVFYNWMTHQIEVYKSAK